jgi:hypothetical protein
MGSSERLEAQAELNTAPLVAFSLGVLDWLQRKEPQASGRRIVPRLHGLGFPSSDEWAP